MRPAHLYVHVPFCRRRCSYCDFAIAVRKAVPVDEYLRLVEIELDLRYGGDAPWMVRTIYLGGGTPSRLGPDAISRLMSMLLRRIRLESSAEITIEANPDDVTVAAAQAWRDAGINRVSLGAQSFNDGALKWMHRVHDSASIPAAVESLRSGGFDNISLDLIFALPASLRRDWRNDLRQAIALGPSHVSLYGLTVEANAPLGRWVARGEATEAPEERYEEEFLVADEFLTGAGFEHYEVSSFSKAGQRARHNRAYWQGVSYAGVGPGAHEFAPPQRRWNVREYATWVRRLESSADPVDGVELLTDANRTAEAVYLGLRTTDGLAVDATEAAFVEPWIKADWAKLSPANRLTLTPLGWLRLDSLAAALTLLRSR